MSVMSDAVVYHPKKGGVKNLAKQQWQQSFANDPIDLRHLPKPIVIKTRQILVSNDSHLGGMTALNPALRNAIAKRHP